MSYDYFYGQSGELFSYFRIPKALFQDHRFRQLSTDARTLYGILLDRMSLSVKNGWLDEQGRVYIIYTVREVQELLCAVGEPYRYAETTMTTLCAGEEFTAKGKVVLSDGWKGIERNILISTPGAWSVPSSSTRKP
jgi:hypothetical protein